MDRALSLAASLALALAGAGVAAHEVPPGADGPGVQGFQRSHVGADLEPAAALRTDEFGIRSPTLRELARGQLWRAPVGEQGSLTLRLRGGTLALVWAVPLKP